MGWRVGVGEGAPWAVMFAGDVVICGEGGGRVEERLEGWRCALERGGMRVGGRKTEYMCVSERQDGSGGTVGMRGEGVAGVEDFKCLGSAVQGSGECGGGGRVRAGWDGWRRVSGVVCDGRVPAGVGGGCAGWQWDRRCCMGWRRWRWRRDGGRRWGWRSGRCCDFRWE